MTDTDTAGTEFVFPVEDLVERYRRRVEGSSNETIPAVVEAWTADRGMFWSCLVYSGGSHHPRDAALAAADLMARASHCDYLVLSLDTHTSTSQTNPRTGKKWAEGEMQNLCDQEGLCESGVIRDNLLLMVIRRDRKIWMQGIPYHRHHVGATGTEVMFYEPELATNEWAGDDESSVGGLIPDTLREIMTGDWRADVLSTVTGKALSAGLSADAIRMHMIMAGIGVLGSGDAQYLHALNCATQEERDILDHSAEVNGLINEPLSVHVASEQTS